MEGTTEVDYCKFLMDFIEQFHRSLPCMKIEICKARDGDRYFNFNKILIFISFKKLVATYNYCNE